MKQQIIEFYFRNGIRLGILSKASTRDIGFDIASGKKLVGLLKENNILIQGIELYKKQDLQYDPYDFWYQGSSLEENYSLLEKYLLTISNSIYYMNLRLFDSSFKDELDALIYEKYGNLDPLPPLIGRSFD